MSFQLSYELARATMEIKSSQPNRPREPWYQSSRIVLERVEARLLRFWESRNVKKDGELMGFDILLVDGKIFFCESSSKH
ncbi:hypothetical protein HID58_006158 [Brassica napus]|uniref:Uncharacterized protein n=1 Tax=Brassica napus TaxID=3708 RepID=A0ABQ8EAL4_BRANA|nr:hypothetical protein HID58_006158 [Brassica napus]